MRRQHQLLGLPCGRDSIHRICMLEQLKLSNFVIKRHLRTLHHLLSLLN